jgi:hypothetical protein
MVTLIPNADFRAKKTMATKRNVPHMKRNDPLRRHRISNSTAPNYRVQNTYNKKKLTGSKQDKTPFSNRWHASKHSSPKINHLEN